MRESPLTIDWDNPDHVALARSAAIVLRKTKGRILRDRILLAASAPGILLAFAVFREARRDSDTELLIVSIVILVLSAATLIGSLVIGRTQHNRAEGTLLEAKATFGIENDAIPELAYASIAVDRTPNRNSAEHVSQFLETLRRFYPLVVGGLTRPPSAEHREELVARYGEDIRQAREHGVMPK